MPPSARLIVLAEDSAMDRLRRDGGCRALADPSLVEHLPLVEDPREPEGGRDEVELGERYEQASGRDGGAVVALCELVEEGDLHRFAERLEALGGWLSERLQHDRTPFPLAACVIVSHGPIGGVDRAALDRLVTLSAERDLRGDAAAGGIATIVPSAIPVYVMVHRTRLDHQSRSWSCRDVWPAAVARLLASIALDPRRPAGLRAWRSVAITYSEEDARGLEREVIEIVREAVDSVDDDVDPTASSSPDRMRTETPPSDRVDDSGVPRHRLDKHGASASTREPVPGFWSLEPSLGVGVGGGVSHVDLRLDLARGSPWRDRFSERGRRFIADRFRRAVESLRVLSGPNSILRKVWRGIHVRHEHLRWHARGGFFTTGARRELDELGTQKLAWDAIESLDAERDRRIRRAKAESVELDLARSHFVGVGWRLSAIGASGLFAAAIVGSVTSMLDPAWTLATGVASGLAAAVTGLVLLLLEVRAGTRGRERLEREASAAEQAIARSFAARLALAARGELLHRSTSWIQNCARVRDAAARLLALWELSLDAASGLGIARSVGAGAALRRWSLATTVQVAADLSYDAVARTVREDRPHLLPELRRRFETFWGSSLRTVDPHEVGDVVARRLGRMLAAELRGMRDEVRGTLIGVVEHWVGEDWAEDASRQVVEVFGLGTEFAGLSVSTRKASGASLRRVIRAHASSELVARRLGESLHQATLDGSPVSHATGPLEPWGCAALAIEEIDVSLPVDRALPTAVFVEGRSRAVDAVDGEGAA